MKGRGPDKQPRRSWGPADDVQLAELMADNVLSHAEIGALVDRSPNAVKMRCAKLGIRVPPAVQKARALAALADKRQDPVWRARIGAGVRAAFTDERREHHRERCTRLKLWEAGSAVLATDAGARERRAVAARRTILENRHDQMAWCPLAWRDVARHNRLVLGSAAEAKRVTLDEIAACERRAAAERAAEAEARRQRMMRGGGAGAPVISGCVEQVNI